MFTPAFKDNSTIHQVIPSIKHWISYTHEVLSKRKSSTCRIVWIKPQNVLRYLTISSATLICQPVGNYQLAGSYELSQDVLRYLTISSAIFNYQPTVLYELSQDVLRYLTISSAIFNYQPTELKNWARMCYGYQPLGSCELSQVVLWYLAVSSAFLNYQPIGAYELNQDVLRYF